MGLFDVMTNHAHKSELRESKDEIFAGALIHGLQHRGWRCFRLVADSDRQTIGFKLPEDEILDEAYIVIDRKTGSGSLSQALGSKTVVGFIARVRNKVTDPDDLANMWRTDFANLLKMPVAGEVRLDHQLNSVNAKTYYLIDLNQYVSGTSVAIDPLVDWSVAQIDALRGHLHAHKKQ